MSSVLEIIVRAIKQGTGFSDAQKDAANLDKTIGGLNKILGMAGLALGAKELIDFGKASVDAALESAAANAELQTALESTGQASVEYKNKLDELATALENTSLFSDETIQKAEATLVSFRNLGQDVMPRTIQVVADMGQKMGDMGAAAQLAGIALNAPEQAAARLQRQGIMLSQQQKEQIATFVEMGNTAGAQGVILDALTTKYGGQAVAARDAAGGMQDWAVATGRLQEEFGKLLLAMGTESGVGGASVGLVDTLTEGSTVWADNVVQIGLFIDALNRANETLANTGEVTGAATQELSEFQKSQKGLEIIFLTVANAAIESTIGFEALAEAYGEVQEEADAAADAMEGTAQAANDMSSASNRAALASYASMRGMMSQAEAARELENAFRQSAAAAASAQAASSFGGQQDSFTQNQNLIQLQQTNDARVKYQEDQKRQEEQAAAESERTFKESTQAMVAATNELGNQISSAVSGAISGVNQDVIGQLLGIEGAEANAGEAVRRMAAVAAGGIQNEWAPALAAQLTGVQDATAQAFVQAFQAGDSGALQGAARQLALNPIVDMFDANLIAQQVEQKLRAQQLTQQLNDKVNALLGEKGLPAVQSVTQQVGQAATDTGIATGQVQQSTADMAASAEAAGAAIKTKFTEAVAAIDILQARMVVLKSTIEGIKKEAGLAAGAIAGMNVPAAGSLVPTEAQRRMGGLSAL